MWQLTVILMPQLCPPSLILLWFWSGQVQHLEIKQVNLHLPAAMYAEFQIEWGL